MAGHQRRRAISRIIMLYLLKRRADTACNRSLQWKRRRWVRPHIKRRSESGHFISQTDENYTDIYIIYCMMTGKVFKAPFTQIRSWNENENAPGANQKTHTHTAYSGILIRNYWKSHREQMYLMITLNLIINAASIMLIPDKFINRLIHFRCIAFSHLLAYNWQPSKHFWVGVLISQKYFKCTGRKNCYLNSYLNFFNFQF